MNKFTEIDKMSKKAQKEYHAKQRVTNGFNTGTRDMNTDKHPTRAKEKRNFQKMLDNY